MKNEEIKSKIKSFLEKHQLTVIATVDDDKPESAVIAFAEREDLSLIFGTSNKTRKYKNLQKNKNVSFVIGWSHEIGTVQYEGIAREMSVVEAVEQSKYMILKNKQTEKFITCEDQRLFSVTPTWIRIVDKSVKPDDVQEIVF